MANRTFESKIQDIVYNFDVGLGLRVIQTAIFVMVTVILMIVFTATQFRGLRDAEAMDLAQVGRSFAEQNRLNTLCIRPASMWALIEHRNDPQIGAHPDLYHPPLYPALLGVLFKFAPAAFRPVEQGVWTPEQWVIVPVGHLFTFLTGLLIFLMARRLFDLRTAILSTVLYFLSDAVWRMAISGLAIPMATFLCTLAVYFALVSAQGRDRGKPPGWGLLALAASAVCCGLAFLTRYGTVVMIPALAVYAAVSAPSRRWLWAALYAAIALAVISPWVVRNMQVCGKPLGLAPYTCLNGDNPVQEPTFDRTISPKLSPAATMPVLKTKLIRGLRTLYTDKLRTMGDGIFTVLFLATFLYGFARPQVRRLRWIAALILVLLLPLMALYGEPSHKLLHLLLPFVLVYSSGFFFILFDRMASRSVWLRRGMVAAVIALAIVPMGFTFALPRSMSPYPPYSTWWIWRVSAWLDEDEFLCTDMPWATAWYAHRRSLLLPGTMDEFIDINDLTRRVNGLYFTPISTDRAYTSELLNGSMSAWAPLFQGRIPSDFPIRYARPLDNYRQFFFTDRDRFEQKR